MQNYLIAILNGIVQGLTEFIPVSSSGHLILLHKMSSLSVNNELLFDVLLHLATVFAVLWFFRNDVLRLFVSWLKSIGGEHSRDSKLAWLILLSTLPAGLAGVIWGDWFEELRDPRIVAFMLVLVGIMFILAEKKSRQTLDIFDMNTSKSIMIGIAQSIALIPGTSRSGITIVTGLALGIKREAAIRFSFLMAIPIIIGANIKKMTDSSILDIGISEIPLYFLAFLSAFITGLLAIKYFLRYSRKNTLIPFAYYRFVLAVLVILFLV